MNPIVSKQQMLRLLDKLARDDLFRSRFERNPKGALLEAEFSAAELGNFPAEQLMPGTLAPKALFEAARMRVQSDLAEQCSCMIIPGPAIASRSDAVSARSSTFARAA